MDLTKIRALLKSAGHTRTAKVDRVSVRYHNGHPIGIDVMFSNGNVDYIADQEA